MNTAAATAIGNNAVFLCSVPIIPQSDSAIRQLTRTIINEIKYGTKENPKSINSPLMNYLAKQGNMGTAESKTYFEDNLIHEYAIIDKSDSHCTVVNLTFQDNTDGEPLKIEKTIVINI